VKLVSIILKSEVHLVAEVPDDWDAYEYWNRDSQTHDWHLQALAEIQGASYEIASIVDLPKSSAQKPHFMWNGKDVVLK